MAETTDAFSRFEKEGWRKAAAHYEAFWFGLTSLFVPHLLASLRVGPGHEVLDVCCGPGLLCAEVQRLGGTSVGVDFAPEMVTRARALYPGLEFREGDAQRLPFGDQTFDAVATNFGVLHLSRPETAFAEAARVLRRGGRYGFTVWAGPGRNPLAGIVDGAIEAEGEAPADLPEGPPVFRFADLAECRRTLGNAGFLEASVRCDPVTVDWAFPSAAFLFEAERVAGVRTAAVLARQPPHRLRAIEAAIEEGLTAYRSATGFRIPATAFVASVSVPGA